MGGVFSRRLTFAQVVLAAVEVYHVPQGHRFLYIYAQREAQRLGLGREIASLRRFAPDGTVARVPLDSGSLPLDRAVLGVAGATICLRKTGRTAEPCQAGEPFAELEEMRQHYLQIRSSHPKPYDDPDLLSVLWVAFALRGWLPTFPQHVGEVELIHQFAVFFQWQAKVVLSRAARL